MSLEHSEKNISHNPNCPFCQVLTGKRPGFILFRNEHIASILSLEGHPLVIPVSHLEKLDEETASKIGSFVYSAKTEDIIKNVYQATGLNTLSSVGEDAGQEQKHYHVHLIPRYANDNLRVFANKLNTKNTLQRSHIASLIRGKLPTIK